MDREYLEGRHALAEALDAGVPMKKVYASSAAFKDRWISSLLSKVQEAGIEIEPASAKSLDELSTRGAHQGIIAEVEPFQYIGVNELVGLANSAQDVLVIVCDHITDAGNFGAIVRTADVVGAMGVVIPNKRSVHVTPATYKTSAGAIAYVPIAMEANIAQSLERLKDAGFWVVGASEHAQTVLWDAPMSGRIALVMGSEDKGLAQLTEKTCDMLVKLPQKGHVESLNVAQAATALSYEWMRQCNATKS